MYPSKLNVEISSVDMVALKLAKQLLENPGIAARITNYVGMPLESTLRRLPGKWSEKLGDITKEALLKAADAAIFTMKNEPGKSASNFWHKLGVATTGGVGGFFGWTGLAVELPVSTTIMLRSIADIARSNGENIDDVETRLSCLEVFALGGPSKSDDATDTGYYATKAFLANSLSEAAKYLSRKGVVDKSAPALLRFIAQIAERFGIQVSEKISVQAVPLIGAAGGAVINALFMDHFQDMARGHFTIRRLERKYGVERLQRAYEAI